MMTQVTKYGYTLVEEEASQRVSSKKSCILSKLSVYDSSHFNNAFITSSVGDEMHTNGDNTTANFVKIKCELHEACESRGRCAKFVM